MASSTFPPEVAEKWASVEEVAEMLKVTKQTVHNYVRDGVLKSNNGVKCAGKTMVSRKSAERYLQSLIGDDQ